MKNAQINAGGIETNYLSEGDGPPIILVHGGGLGTDSWGNWRGCIPLLAKHFRVFAIDMLGFGRTAKPDPKTFRYDQDSRVRHIAAFIERLGLVRPSLVGNAMGGITSLGVAMERPDLVSKLVLTGSPGIRGPESNATRVVMSYQPTPEYMRKLVTALTGPGFKIDPELIEYRYRLTQTPGLMEAYAAIQNAIADQGGLYYPEERIAQVKHPTLIVNGKLDTIVTPESAWRHSQLLENSWLYLIPGCGHWTMVERTEEFCHVASWFLMH